MAVQHAEPHLSWRFFCAVGVIFCIFIPAITLYGQTSFEYSYEITSSVVEVISTTFADVEEAVRDEYIAICLAVKDQGPDLPEFLQHHYYNMGIQRFYIMDDGSDPPMSSYVDEMGVPEEALTFVYYNETQHQDAMQFKVYTECATIYGVNNTWLAFIDTDEFIDTPGNETLDEILQSFEPLPSVGGVSINWQTHTSNNQQARADSVRETYTECIYDDPENDGDGTDNKHVKSIVRTRDYGFPINPHVFALREDKITVGEHGDPMKTFAFRQPITRDRISLHHYALKSRHEYEEKIMRSNAMSQAKGWEFWNHINHELPLVNCTDMLRWL